MPKAAIKISYFSDLLCVWAYVAQIRLETLKDKFQQQIEITPFHVTLFGDTEERIAVGWKDRGGYEGFAEHVQQVCLLFPHVELNDGVWRSCRPKTSGNSHLFLKAVQLHLKNSLQDVENELARLELLKKIEWDTRLAFFRDARDIGDFNVLYQIAEMHAVKKESIVKYLNDGSAMSLFCSEVAMRDNFKLEGSPTYVLNENRQKLFGNVSYKIMEANVLELISDKSSKQASWC